MTSLQNNNDVDVRIGQKAPLVDPPPKISTTNNPSSNPRPPPPNEKTPSTKNTSGTKRTTAKNAHQNLSEKKLRRLEKNRLSARECRRRKREAAQELEREILRIEGENMRLRLQLQIGEEAEETSKKEQEAFTESLDALLKSGASETEVYGTMEEYKKKFSDYGRDRRSAIEFHLKNVRRLLMPTTTTSVAMRALRGGDQVNSDTQKNHDNDVKEAGPKSDSVNDNDMMSSEDSSASKLTETSATADATNTTSQETTSMISTTETKIDATNVGKELTTIAATTVDATKPEIKSTKISDTATAAKPETITSATINTNIIETPPETFTASKIESSETPTTLPPVKSSEQKVDPQPESSETRIASTKVKLEADSTFELETKSEATPIKLESPEKEKLSALEKTTIATNNSTASETTKMPSNSATTSTAITTTSHNSTPETPSPSSTNTCSKSKRTSSPPPTAPKSLFQNLVNHLRVTPSQAIALKDSRYVAKELDACLAQSLSLLDELEQRLTQCGEDLEAEFDSVRAILTPTQAAKFLIWIKNNGACMYMLDELWSNKYPSNGDDDGGDCE